MSGHGGFLFTAALLGGAALAWAYRQRRRAPRRAAQDGRRRVALCACGSVAAVKAPEIAEALILGTHAEPQADAVYVDLVLTGKAAFFQHVLYRKSRPAELLRRLRRYRDAEGVPYLEVWTDEDEWEDYSEVGSAEGSRVLHIDLAKRNAVLVFAPLSANTLGKLALGLCDNLGTCLARAWTWDLGTSLNSSPSPSASPSPRSSMSSSLVLVDTPDAPPARAGPMEQKPVIIAPAMNTVMWQQHVTGRHLRALEARGAEVVAPQVKELACGDVGNGALAPVAAIVEQVLAALR